MVSRHFDLLPTCTNELLDSLSKAVDLLLDPPRDFPTLFVPVLIQRAMLAPGAPARIACVPRAQKLPAILL